MQEPHFTRERSEALMRAAGLDALAVFQPESVAYVSGVNPAPAGLFRRAGAASALVPADPALPLAAVLPDLSEGAAKRGACVSEIRFHPIWVDTARALAHDGGTALRDALAEGAQVARPATFDARTSFALLRDQLAERGLARARIGIDMNFIPAADFEMLRACLPEARLVDGSEVIARLKMVKSAQEVEWLRQALRFSEAGLAAAEKLIRPGVTQGMLSRAYGEAARNAAAGEGAALTGLWDYISIGPDPWGPGRAAEAGDIVKFDIGTLVSGYSSDFARTVCLGKPSRAARELHTALLGSLEAGLHMLKPGTRLADVHARMLAAAREGGIPGYARGHFGHSLGAGTFSEEWPFIAADSEVIAEPGMVLAVEAPLYVDGLGGFIIEDQVLVTETGIEVMSRGDRSLRVF